MRAKSNGINREVPPARRATPDRDDSVEMPMLDRMDDMVIVAFPRATWDNVQEIAVERGVAPAAILSIALELLKEKMVGGEDGTRGR